MNMISARFSRFFKTYSVLKPHIDISSRLDDLPKLHTIAKRRKIDVNINDVADYHVRLEHLKSVQSEIENSRHLVTQKLSKLSSKEKNSDEERQLKMTAKVLREDYKQLKSALVDLQDQMTSLVMQIPNELHDKTKDEDQVIHEKCVFDQNKVGHFEIGQNLNCVEFKTPWMYYLKNEAAFQELKCVNKLSKIFKKCGFVGFSNPDFVRTIVLDGCEGTHSLPVKLNKFEGDQDELFLSGGASCLPFYSLFCKTILSSEDLPVRCFAAGRRYSFNLQPKFGLYDVPQTTSVEIFTLTSLREENPELDAILSTLTEYYESLNVPFRVVLKSASQLRSAETLRASFEVYSSHYDRFFDCGFISLHGTQLCKNMNIRISDDVKDSFPHVISGSVFNSAPMIACMLENKLIG